MENPCCCCQNLRSSWKGDRSVQRPQAGGLEQDKLLVPRFGIHPEVTEDPPVTEAKPEAQSFRECGRKGGGTCQLMRFLETDHESKKAPKSLWTPARVRMSISVSLFGHSMRTLPMVTIITASHQTQRSDRLCLEFWCPS